MQRSREYIERTASQIVPNKVTKDLLFGGAATVFYRLLGQLASFVFIIIANRLFGPLAIGANSFTTRILFYIQSLAINGYTQTMVRVAAESNQPTKRHLVRYYYVYLLRRVVLVAVIASLVLAASSPFLANTVFEKPYLTPFLIIMSVGIVPLALITLMTSALKGLNRLREYVLLNNLVISGFEVVILIALFLFSRSDYVLNIAYVMALIVVAFVSWRSLYRHLRTLGMLEESFQQKVYQSIPLDVLKRSTRSFTVMSIISLLTKLGELLIVGRYLSAIDIAVYSVVDKVTTLITLVVRSVNDVVLPKLGVQQADSQSFKLLVEQATKLMWWLGIPLLILYFFSADFMMRIIGSEFVVHNGVQLLQVSLLAFLFQIVFGPLDVIFTMSKQLHIYRNITVVFNVLNLALKFVLVQYYGVFGLVYSSILAEAIGGFVLLILFRISYGFYPLNLKTFFKMRFVSKAMLAKSTKAA